MELTEWLKEQAVEPKWNEAGKVHDWRNHVPPDIRKMWGSFMVVQRYALVAWADELASNEHWD